MDIENLWWNAFSDSYGVEFEKARPNYEILDKKTQMVGALMKLQLDMYNGGFVQFFCNWGYDAYLLAIEGLKEIKAITTIKLLKQCYFVIAKYENDSRLSALWDIPAVLTNEECQVLDEIETRYYEDTDGIMQRMLDCFS